MICASSGPAVNPDYGATRTIDLKDDQDLDLDIFIDGSLCEIFINNGRHVATLRFFAPTPNQKIAFDKILSTRTTMEHEFYIIGR